MKEEEKNKRKNMGSGESKGWENTGQIIKALVSSRDFILSLKTVRHSCTVLWWVLYFYLLLQLLYFLSTTPILS